MVHTFCSYTAKTTPIFYFMILNKDSAYFRWEKNWHKSMFPFFCNFTKSHELSYYGSPSAGPI